MIYLDSAATSLQKPPEVARAAASAMKHMASPGRGGYPAAMAAADTLFACRETAARLFHVPEPDQVVLTMNATHGLNLAIKTLVSPGDTVLISGYEHNAVTRPLAAIPDVTVKAAEAPLFQPESMAERFRALLTPEVTCVICTHVSNVFGYVLPVREIAGLCQERGVPFVLDASQSAGTLPVHMDELGAAFIAMPGHKGLYGPQGTGLLLCARSAAPLLEGGTGSLSALQTMPEFLPDRLEAGTHNVPGAAGLLEGLRFVERMGPGQILTHERRLAAQCAQGLTGLDGVTVWSAPRLAHQAGVLAFRVEGMDCEETGERLGRLGIAVRAGLHCAPLAHRTAGTLETGAVRASFSAFNSAGEVRALVRAVSSLRDL
ncbi:aminotransferase class V-fold PLP-dependent enzyme [Intestinimonas sp.]|uniref:aminotransferase class V-fold PLP-dependent enzyme n=1 Tax=Intestinimonas sp. TaxID=1965293 RepID=UPI002622860B|nr:aminotransferase class V-fold PLP-dependent enzyme [Intestinimonas sp.]